MPENVIFFILMDVKGKLSLLRMNFNSLIFLNFICLNTSLQWTKTVYIIIWIRVQHHTTRLRHFNSYVFFDFFKEKFLTYRKEKEKSNFNSLKLHLIDFNLIFHQKCLYVLCTSQLKSFTMRVFRKFHLGNT